MGVCVLNLHFHMFEALLLIKKMGTHSVKSRNNTVQLVTTDKEGQGYVLLSDD